MKVLSLILGFFLATVVSASDRFGPPALLTGPPTTAQHSVRSAYLRSGPLYVWVDDALRAGRYAGSPLPPSEVHFVAPAADGKLALAALGDQALLVFTDHGSSFVARLAADGTVLSQPFMVGTGLVTTPVTVAASGDRWLVIWGEASRIFGITIGRNGERLSGPTTLVDGPTLIGQLSAASNGSEFVIVWSAFYRSEVEVNGLGVSPAGLAMEETRTRISERAMTPSIAFGASEYLITWARADGGGLSGRRLRSASDLPAPAATLVMTTVSDVPVWMAWDGGSYEIATYRTVTFHQYTIHYAEVLRVGPTGIVADALSDAVTISADFAIAAGEGRVFNAYVNGSRQIEVQSVTLSALPTQRGRITR